MSIPGFGLIPGSNTSGTNYYLPFAPQQGGQASLGGPMNPLLSTTGTGTSMPVLPQGAVSTSATSGFPANTGGYPAPAVPGGGGGTGTGSALGFPTSASGQKDLFRNLEKTYGAGLAKVMMGFLQGGAGFNQTAINNLIAAMQPGFERDQQQLLTSFSAMGNRFGSGAEIGLADLMSQEQLNVGQLEAQMYEQSVQNFINVLMGVSGPTAQRIQSNQGGGLGGILGSIAQTAIPLITSMA